MKRYISFIFEALIIYLVIALLYFTLNTNNIDVILSWRLLIVFIFFISLIYLIFTLIKFINNQFFFFKHKFIYIIIFLFFNVIIPFEITLIIIDKISNKLNMEFSIPNNIGDVFINFSLFSYFLAIVAVKHLFFQSPDLKFVGIKDAYMKILSLISDICLLQNHEVKIYESKYKELIENIDYFNTNMTSEIEKYKGLFNKNTNEYIELNKVKSIIIKLKSYLIDKSAGNNLPNVKKDFETYKKYSNFDMIEKVLNKQ